MPFKHQEATSHISLPPIEQVQPMNEDEVIQLLMEFQTMEIPDGDAPQGQENWEDIRQWQQQPRKAFGGSSQASTSRTTMSKRCREDTIEEQQIVNTTGSLPIIIDDPAPTKFQKREHIPMPYATIPKGTRNTTTTTRTEIGIRE